MLKERSEKHTKKLPLKTLTLKELKQVRGASLIEAESIDQF